MMMEKTHEEVPEQEREIREQESSAKKKQELVSYNGADKVITFDEMDVRLKEKPKAEGQVLSRMPTLDELTQGFREGELIVVSGPPKSGKTLLLQTLTYEFAQQNALCIWFSYEVVARDFLDRFPTMPVAYLPTIMKSNKPDWIEERVLEAKAKYGIRVVFIDHLHYIIDMGSKNPSLEIGAVLRRLRTMAVNHNLIVFIICHTGKIEEDKDPTYRDMRDSSFTGQEPDTVLMVWRKKDNEKTGFLNRAVISVELSRRGGAVGKHVKVVMDGGLLKEV